MAGPLTGKTVVELCDDLPGAFAGMLLADMGATVIRVETEHTRRLGMLVESGMWERGKQSLALAATHLKAPEVLDRLLRSADVILESRVDSPQIVEASQIQKALQAHPGIVHCLLLAFPQGSAFSHLPGRDGMVGAASGMMHELGFGGPPQRLQVPLASHATGLLAAYGVVAALLEAQRTGRGRRVQVSAYEAALMLQGSNLIAFPGIRHQGGRGPQGTAPRRGCTSARRAGWCFR